uniref:PKD domain-containing protein n=1 Tax=uncultured marine group II/III euryarchaeote KM3_176_D12 TaxID=1457936 RepID=A0A075GSM5_9EURY|nr:hypothetical protein [uncultured marine group II/III euryarchaeote KM3_176_D12]
MWLHPKGELLKGRTSAQLMMRWSVAVSVALLMLLGSMVPATISNGLDLDNINQQAGAKDPPCPATNVSNLPPMVNLADQTCLQVSLGTLAPGSLVSIEATVTGNSADLLFFAANSVGTYLNDQSYRTSSIWEADASVESLSGDAEWHWEVPTDRSETAWFLILDNLAHSGDQGNGGQGGNDSNITISVTFPTMSYWTLIDSLQVLAPGSHVALLGPSELTLDAGTQVSVTALPLSGVGDLFILTESQKDTYLLGGGGSFWVPGTQMLSITTATSQPWTVPSDLAGQPLYLFLDNEAGPTGGGDGLSPLRITVSVTLLPVLNPVISSADDLTDVDVKEQVSFDVESTPNLSQQADLSQTEWDFDGDGSIDATGESVTTLFSSPGNRSVKAIIIGPDGRSSSNTIPVSVIDSSNPNSSILGSDTWQRDVDASFTLTSTSVDNWQVVREEWRVDGTLISSFTNSLPSSFTHAINTTGEHIVELTAVDGANNIDATVVTIIVRDGTKPVVGDIVAIDTVMAGTSMTFSVNASDPESDQLAYTWDFDKEVDSDGDSVTGNDIDATGSTVAWTFSVAKPTYVTVTVTNDANLSKTVQILVDVEVDPSAVSSSSSPLDSLVPFIILVIIVVLGGGGWFAWNKRKAKLHEEAVALAQAASEEEAQEPEPERDDQLTMYAPSGSQSGGYGGGGDASIAALAGTGYSQGIVSDDALAAFGDDDEPQEVAEKDPILDDLDFLRSKDEKPATEVAKPQSEPQAPTIKSEGKVAKRSSGIALPDSAGVSTPQPSVQSKAAPTAKPVAEPEPEVVDSTTVKASCPSCEQMFAVDMPNDVEQALVACPKCDQRIRLEK